MAWRSLLRQHHPDVAGPSGLERAKRINVAHDWLSDPDLRARYDRERGLRRVGPRDGRRPRTRGPATPGREPRPAAGPPRAGRPIRPRRSRGSSTGSPTLDPDELDRLACADPTPIAFGATIAPVPAAGPAGRPRGDGDGGRRAARSRRPRHGRASATRSRATRTELVLGSFLDDLLSEPFRERTRERLTRGWEAAVGQPRYGPNGVAVRGLIAAARATSIAAGVAELAARPACPARRPVRRTLAAGHLARRRRGASGSRPCSPRAMPPPRSAAAWPTARRRPAPAGPRPGSPTCSCCGTPSRRRRSPR